MGRAWEENVDVTNTSISSLEAAKFWRPRHREFRPTTEKIAYFALQGKLKKWLSIYFSEKCLKNYSHLYFHPVLDASGWGLEREPFGGGNCFGVHKPETIRGF